MTPKWGFRSGILVAILAQCAALAACGADGDGDLSLDSDDASGGTGPTGTGGYGAGGEEPASTGGDEGCENLLIVHPITVNVRGGWQEAEEECRATVALIFSGKTHELECEGSGSDCTCSVSPAMGIPRDGVTLTVSDGETVLHDQSDLQDLGQCDGPSFGEFEVDYIEALREAVSHLKGAADELVSPEPCDTAADCEAIPLGAKACGGPWSYVVASKQSETYDEVAALSEELQRIEGLYNELAEVSSDCAYEIAPDLICEESMCSRISPD